MAQTDSVTDVRIRLLNTVPELEEMRKLAARIWGEKESIPTHQTLTACKNGGLVLGAFIGEELVGFQYSFPGYDGKRVYLCSHELGIDAAYRSKKIGERLKQAQREEALRKGYSLITWTYDPLESVNGYLNIAKLGGVCSQNIVNCYGDMDDLLNSGLPSDRFLVEWWIAEAKPAVQPPLSVEELPAVRDRSLLTWHVNEQGWSVPEQAEAPQSAGDEPLYVPIPSGFQQLKEQDRELALAWRLQTREVFMASFERGFEVAGFVKNPDPAAAVHFYQLRRKAARTAGE